MSSSDSLATHSSTTYADPSASSTSKTWEKRGSFSLLAALAAATTSATRSKPAANVSTVTERARVSSIAFQYVQSVPPIAWSTRRYRPASRVPGSDV